MEKTGKFRWLDIPRDLLVVALALFTWGIGEGMFIYFQPLYLQSWGANPLEIGAILSMVGLAVAVAQVPAGYLSDKVGSRPVMWSAWVIGLLATVVMALAGSLPVFVAGLMLYSSTSYVSVPMSSYIASMRGRWSVERAMTMVLAMTPLGMVAGPVLGGWIGERLGLQSVYRIAAGIFVISTLIIFLARRPAQRARSVSLEERRGLAANPRFLGLLAMIFFTMLSLNLPQPLTSIYLKDLHGFTVQQIGQTGAIVSLSNALIMLAMGFLNASTGILVGQALVGLFAMMMWQGASPAAFFIGYLFLGGYRLARSMSLAYARSLVHDSETGLAFGLVETGTGISVIIAPLAAGFIYQRSPQMIYITSLAAIAIMFIINILRFAANRRAALDRPPPYPSEGD